MSLPIVQYIGLDVAKRSLDVDLLGSPLHLAHDGAGCKTLVAKLRALPHPVHVVCEATGGWERPVVGALHAAGITVSVVNPRQVRDYARGIGKLAKTDKIDAKVLSAFGASVKDLHPTPPSSSPTVRTGRLGYPARATPVDASSRGAPPDPRHAKTGG